MYRLLLAFAIGAVNLVAVDVSGKWSGTMAMNSGPVNIYLTLEHHEHQISGTVSTEEETNQVPIEKSEIRGSVLTFEVHDNANRIVKFRLSLTNLVLTGEAIVVGQLSEVSFWRSDLISAQFRR